MSCFCRYNSQDKTAVKRSMYLKSFNSLPKSSIMIPLFEREGNKGLQIFIFNKKKKALYNQKFTLTKHLRNSNQGAGNISFFL